MAGEATRGKAAMVDVQAQAARGGVADEEAPQGLADGAARTDGAEKSSDTGTKSKSTTQT